MLGSIKMKLAIALFVIGIICAIVTGITYGARHLGPLPVWQTVGGVGLVAFVCATILFVKAYRARRK